MKGDARMLVELIIIVVTVTVLLSFSRALAVNMTTGKWPHQDERAAEIFREMP